MLNFIQLISEDEKKSIKFSFLKLPVCEDKIMEKSMQMFGERHPCIIQKIACINALNLDLQKKISKKYIEHKIYELSEIEPLLSHLPKEYIEKNYCVKFLVNF